MTHAMQLDAYNERILTHELTLCEAEECKPRDLSVISRIPFEG